MSGAYQALPAAVAAARDKDFAALSALIDWPLTGAPELTQALPEVPEADRAATLATGLAELDAAAGRPDQVLEILVGLASWLASAHDVAPAVGRVREQVLAALALPEPPAGLPADQRERLVGLRARAAAISEVYLLMTDGGELPVALAPETGRLVLVVPPGADAGGLSPIGAASGDAPGAPAAFDPEYEALQGLARGQLGMVTGAQARRVGVDAAALGRYERGDRLDPVALDVWALPGLRAAPRYGHPYAAWLALVPERTADERPPRPQDDAVLSHESAAHLHGIGRLSLRVTVFTAAAPMPAPPGVTVRVARLAPADIERTHGVPVTTPHRTILDVFVDGVDEENLSRLIEDAVRQDLVDVRRLHQDLIALDVTGRIPRDGPTFLATFVPNLRSA